MSHLYDTESDSDLQLPTVLPDSSLQLPTALPDSSLRLPTARVRPRILVVEDEPSIRALLRLHLSLANFDVEERGEGTDALDLARSEKFRLILLDVMLPGLDGLTLCRALRTQGANAGTPIMM